MNRPEANKANSERVYLYDTTLRDGSQKKGISYSLEDKLALAVELSEFGFDYIEGGWPGSNPKDKQFFERVKQLDLSSCVVAFGSTRRKNIAPSKDENLLQLISASTKAVAIVGKSSDLHVTRVLETTVSENLNMIKDSVSFCKEAGREVVYDAEHFFDGYFRNRDHALSTLQAAEDAGADWLVLCDTNGGTMPQQISDVVKEVVKNFKVKIGIHAHNDCELAVANSLSAVLAGARQVQGTVNGYGERCGNANLISIVPNLQLKMGFQCVDESRLKKLVHVSRFVSERANLASDNFQAFVGNAAFAHKGGIHVAAVEKCSESYEHIEPTLVGNKREIVVSELSGRGNLRMLSEEWGLGKNTPSAGFESEALQLIKKNEQEGYQYEGAEGSVELIMHQVAKDYEAPFFVTDYVIVSERRSASSQGQKDTAYSGNRHSDSSVIVEGVQAIVKLKCSGKDVHVAADGEGPVHALDLALRKALLPFYPALQDARLTDYKVRILDPDAATEAITRVMLEAKMGSETWTTVGCGRNIISASFKALIDSYELAIVRERKRGRKFMLRAL